jgi:hypothetical protein
MHGLESQAWTPSFFFFFFFFLQKKNEYDMLSVKIKKNMPSITGFSSDQKSGRSEFLNIKKFNY